MWFLLYFQTAALPESCNSITMCATWLNKTAVQTTQIAGVHYNNCQSTGRRSL